MSKIEYEVPDAGHVTIKIVDIIGTQVRVLMNNHEKPGRYTADLKNEALEPGKYYYKIHLNPGKLQSKENDNNNLVSSGQLKREV